MLFLTWKNIEFENHVKKLESSDVFDLVRPVILHTSKTHEKISKETRLIVFERKILKRIYGHFVDNHTKIWKKIHNKELKGLFQRPDIIKLIAKKKMMWAGHV